MVRACTEAGLDTSAKEDRIIRRWGKLELVMNYKWS